jgi:hypothetical protein
MRTTFCQVTYKVRGAVEGILAVLVAGQQIGRCVHHLVCPLRRLVAIYEGPHLQGVMRHEELRLVAARLLTRGRQRRVLELQILLAQAELLATVGPGHLSTHTRLLYRMKSRTR